MTTPEHGDEYAEIDEVADLEAPADAQQQVAGGGAGAPDATAVGCL